MRRASLLLLLLTANGCSVPKAPAPPSPPPPGVVATPPEPEAPLPRDEPAQLMFQARSATMQPIPVYASMDEGAPVAFEIDPGSTGDVLSTAAYRHGGRELTYWEIRCESGHGWAWDGHVSVAPRPRVQEVVASAPAGRETARDPIEVRFEAADESAGGWESPAAAAAQPVAIAAVDVLEINAPGEAVDFKDHLAQGQYTIVDVYSPKCGPCMELGPQLEAFAAEHPRVVLRKVNINRPGARGIDWQSPAAQQFGVSSVPFLQVYGPNGSLVAGGKTALAFIQRIPRT